MSSNKPIIGISTNEIINFGGRQVSHSTVLRYVNAVSKFSNAIPILIPSYINGKDLDLLLKKIDGIVLTGVEQTLSHIILEVIRSHQMSPLMLEETKLF